MEAWYCYRCLPEATLCLSIYLKNSDIKKHCSRTLEWLTLSTTIQLPCSSDSISPSWVFPFKLSEICVNRKISFPSFIALHGSSKAVLGAGHRIHEECKIVRAVSVIRPRLLGVQPNICFIHHIEIGGRNLRTSNVYTLSFTNSGRNLSEHPTCIRISSPTAVEISANILRVYAFLHQEHKLLSKIKLHN